MKWVRPSARWSPLKQDAPRQPRNARAEGASALCQSRFLVSPHLRTRHGGEFFTWPGSGDNDLSILPHPCLCLASGLPKPPPAPPTPILLLPNTPPRHTPHALNTPL